jgi:RNA polymerase sigma-70 factor (ECF subfamily)
MRGQEAGYRDVQEARRAAGGDMQAFESLYRRHAPRVHSLARRMIGEAEADETTQDVFVRAWRKLGTFRGEAAFGTWLHRLAINTVLGRRKQLAIRRTRHADWPGGSEPGSASGGGPEVRMDFETALERLPDGAREVFVLHDVEGYRHREIAVQLGITSGTSKSQLHRARMMMRRHLDAGRRAAHE